MWLLDRDVDDLNIFKGHVRLLVCLGVANFLTGLDPFRYPAKHCVFAVEPLGRNQRDEELRSVGVRTGVGLYRAIRSKQQKDAAEAKKVNEWPDSRRQ